MDKTAVDPRGDVQSNGDSIILMYGEKHCCVPRGDLDLRHPGGRATVDDGVLDLALIRPALDFKVTVVTPDLIPRVRHEPVVHAIFCAEAHDLDGVPAEHRTGAVA